MPRATNTPSPGWGKINSGQPVSLITTDLDRAFAGVRWRRYELRLHQHVREQCWGTTKQVAKNGRLEYTGDVVCEIALYDLAKEWDVNYQNLRRAYRELVNDRLLIEHYPGICAPNKDLTSIPASRFEEGVLEYAKQAWSERKPLEREEVAATEESADASMSVGGHDRHLYPWTRVATDTYPRVQVSAVTTDGDGCVPGPIEERERARSCVPADACGGAPAELNSIQLNSVCVFNTHTHAHAREGIDPAVREAAAVVEKSNQPARVRGQAAAAFGYLASQGYTAEELSRVAGVIASKPAAIRTLLPFVRSTLDHWRLEDKPYAAPDPVPKSDSVQPVKSRPGSHQAKVAQARVLVAQLKAKRAAEASNAEG